MVFFSFHTIHLAVFIWFDDILKRKFYQICKKGFCPKQGKSLKNYAILEVSCKPRGTISSVAKHVFEKKCCKSVAKTVARKVPSPETRINTGFFGTSKPRGTTPTLQQRCASKLFCLEILSSFVLDYLMYPYYPSLPIYCYHFVINLDNSHNISQPVCKVIITNIL